ncbi:unnamed protein product [Phytophthora fragariaefolia]|uniref:Unnamed protein product n=1 Tax=Phytophthora fragariaefolia TaxID=1490495 RepID=A0A9W6Y2S9_9STRA|nr:unnamed protein product [Phytophthora fragariaefolia]
MGISPTSLALLVIAVAAFNGLSSAANLRQVQRNLAATYRQPSDYLPVMVARVNKERAAVGLPPVCANYKLQSSSQRHSDDMADHDYMAHGGTDGSTMEKRITDSGYVWNTAGENVAAGQEDVNSVMDAWMVSPEHRANILGDYNMLGASYTFNGRGAYKHYWTQDFGKSNRESCDSGVSSRPSTPGRVPQNNSGATHNQNQVQSQAGPQATKTALQVSQAPSALSANQLEADLGVVVSPVPKTADHVEEVKTPCPADERSIEELPVQVDMEKDCDPKF